MNNIKQVLIALFLALLFVGPIFSMLQYDSSTEDALDSDVDGTLLTNEQEVEETSEEETYSQEDPIDTEVNVEGDRSSRKFLDAFKLNFDPYDPEDGETVECSATVRNFGRENQIARDVNVEFWFQDQYIGTGIVDEIQPGENGTVSVDWIAEFGSHTMRIVADPDGSDGGPDEYSVLLNVTRSTYSVGLELEHNASWIKNSQTNYYYIKVTNFGSSTDTFDLDFDSMKYGESGSGWSIDLDEESVTLDSDESTYVRLSVEYLSGSPDYLAQAVVEVTAQSRGDTDRHRTVFATTDVIHDVPILIVDDDGQHDVDEDGNPMLPGRFWLDWGGTYGAQCGYLMNASLDKNYKGMYDYIDLGGDLKGGGWEDPNNMGPSGPVFNSQTTGYNPANYPYQDGDGDDIFLENYDAVIWITGYCECLNSNPSSGDRPSSNNDDWYDQEEIPKYLEAGGNFWWMGNSINQYHDREAVVYGESQNDFVRDYFRVQYWSHAGLKPRIMGVTRDPIGSGINVQNGYFYGNYVDSVERGNVVPDIVPMDDAHGVFYGLGSHYSAIRYEHPRESSSSQRFKTFLSGGFENYGDFEILEEPSRIQLVENVLEWFGVPPMNAPQTDVAVTMFNQPFGEFLTPMKAVKINVTLENTGQKDIDDLFQVKFSVDEVGGSNKFQRTITVDEEIPIGEILMVETIWNTNLPQDGKDYTFTVTIQNTGWSGDDTSNNEIETEKTAQEIVDISIHKMWQDWEMPWNAYLVGYDAYFYTKISNYGSTEETFDVNLVIYSPLNTIVFERTQHLTLLPGYSENLEWVWTPRNPGGIMSGYGGGPNDMNDAYRFNLTADVEDDDVPDNNQDEMDVAVMLWWDGGEPVFMKEDWIQYDLSNHDTHGNDDEITPWHLQDEWFLSPNHAWFIANDDREMKSGWNTVIVTPYTISLDGVTRASCISTGSGNNGGAAFRNEFSSDYDGNTENMESATWSSIRTSSYGNEGVWVVGGATTISDSWFDQEVYLRLHFDSSSSDARLGYYQEDFAIFANVDQYNSNDIGVSRVSIEPLIDEAEMPRNIAVTVKNYGENKTNSEGRPGFNVEVSIEDEEGTEVYNRDVLVQDVLGIGDTVTVTFDDQNGRDWVPEENGIYTIYARTIWEQGGKNIDENPFNDVLAIDGIVQKDFFTDDMEGGINEWKTTGHEDGWELGTPSKGPAAHSGSNCWGTNLDGNYPDLNDNSISLDHYVDLRTASDPVLSFWHWLEIEAHNYDTAYVEVRTSEQSKFTTLWESPSPTRQGIPYETEEWKVVTLELDDFAYHEIFIRFRLESDGDTNYLGWYVDDVAVGGTTPPDYDARLVSIDYPAPDEFIPPSETIEILATVMNVGLNQDIIPVTCKAIRQGSTPITYDLGEQSTSVLDPGDREQVAFTWQLPTGTYRYLLEIETNLNGDGNPENDDLSEYIWAKKIFDVSILSIYADPMVQDVARARQITTEIKNVGNTMLENNVEVSFTANFNGDEVDSYKTTVSLERNEVKQVTWDWQSFKYGEYEIEVTVDILGETDNNMLDNEAMLDGIITVETIFSDTREEGESPYYLDHTTGEFKIWDHHSQGPFWSGDNVSNPNLAGWHMDDSGHFSRTSWYGGIPAKGRYGNNMEAIIVSEALNLEGYTDVHLSFFTKYVIEGRQYDYVKVFITNDIDDEDSWYELLKFPENDQSHDSSRELGNEYGWLHKDEMIPAEFIDDTFYMRILMKTDNGITYRGVWIDDITLFGTTTGNHPPVSRFSASIEDENASFSRNVIMNPTMDLLHIKGNYAFNNLPRPIGDKQGGIQLGAEISFEADMSFDPDAGDDDISYQWDFGNGETANGKRVTHSYSGDLPLEGYFIVTLKTSDDHGSYTTDSLLVWIGNKAPDADYIVTPYFDSTTAIDDSNDGVENGFIDVFYGDRVIFQQKSTDPENDFLSFSWVFYCTSSKVSTEATGDTVSGVVGKDFLYEQLEGSEPIVPVSTVTYEVTIYVTDGVSVSEKAYTIQVHPYATADFIKSVNMGATLLEATVTLTWRGFPDQAAPGASYISPERPVFVHIDENAKSPDLNLPNRGGIGRIYEIRAVGCRLQNGEEGFINAEISIPVLTTDLDTIGDSFTLADDLRLEYYDDLEKRFVVVPNSLVVADGGVKYVVGNTDHFSLYTAIVDSVYTGSIQADLSIESIVFSRAPIIDRSETEVRVWIKNIGPINARDIKVRFFDGSELIDEVNVPMIKAMDKNGVWVKAKYNVSMTATEAASEQHNVVVNVNPLHSVKESQYNNNVRQEKLDVVTQAYSTGSFGMSFVMMAFAVLAIVALSETYRRKR